MNTLDDLGDIKGKIILCRVDVSEPLDTDSKELLEQIRVQSCIPTIRELSDKGARVVVMSHQGSDLDYENFYTTAPHAKRMAALLGREVHFVSAVYSTTARTAIRSMRDGEIILLDNLAYLAEEAILFERHHRLSHEQQAKSLLVRKLAPLADLYVCDAFSRAHYSQPSLCGFPQVLPSAMGRLFEEEVRVLFNLIQSPQEPCVFVLGGVKTAETLTMMRAALESGTADQILVGGLVAQTLLWAEGYPIGDANREIIRGQGHGELLDTATDLLDRYASRIVLPTDYGFAKNGQRREAMIHALPRGEMVEDIGTGTAELFSRIIMRAKTVFVNGPMGIYEQSVTSLGTRRVWEALAKTEGYTIVGGRDTVTATYKLGRASQINFLSTGDKALVHLMMGETLPAVEAIRHGSTTGAD